MKLSKIIASFYGKGWFYNIKKDKLYEIPPNDLGSHGDHDGWISIGDNAEKIGIDKNKAMAFQTSFYLRKVSPEFESLIKLCPNVEHDGYIDIGSQAGVPEVENWFKKHFGYSIAEAQLMPFPELIRLRLWQLGLLTINVNSFLPFPLRDIQNALYKIFDEIKYVKEIGITDYRRKIRTDLNELLSAKSNRDFSIQA